MPTLTIVAVTEAGREIEALASAAGKSWKTPAIIPLAFGQAYDFTVTHACPNTEYLPSTVQHRVTLTKGFWMGKYEVTQGQWEVVMGSSPSHFKVAKLLGMLGGRSLSNHPVEQVSWDDCQEFLHKLNARVPDGGFRLPTEAEW